MHLDRAVDVVAGFAGIAELQKEPDVDARLVKQPRGVPICSTRVPFSIASRIRCDPDSAPIHAI
jgi:hypothetical protein